MISASINDHSRTRILTRALSSDNHSLHLDMLRSEKCISDIPSSGAKVARTYLP